MTLKETATAVADQTDGAAAAMPEAVSIPAPNFQVAEFTVRGTAPYVQHRFGEKARRQIQATQEAGSKAKARGKTREPRDLDSDYHEAMHKMADGTFGIPAASFRGAMISACRTVGFVMTRAKLAIFIEQDGVDAQDGQPLVKISKGEPHAVDSYARNETGTVDLRRRPMWDTGWEAVVRVRFDGDMLGLVDIANLLARAGGQVGIGEGRPDSPRSNGVGWGVFSIVADE